MSLPMRLTGLLPDLSFLDRGGVSPHLRNGPPAAYERLTLCLPTA